MLQAGTLFVIGAGVSAELGFPLGRKLRTDISSILPVRSKGSDCIRQAAQGLGENYDSVSRRLQEAIPYAASIDNLIEHTVHDPAMVRIAKLGIAEVILRGERDSTLFVSDDRPGIPIDQEATALLDIFQLIVSGVPRDSLERALRRVSFVTFNYDRSLEHYLTWAIVAYSGLTPAQARELVDGIKIHHPYGSLGDLKDLPFGMRPEHTNLGRVADGIRTFSEEIASGAAETARSLMGEAKRVIFLGCAHHIQNMKLLAPESFAARRVYGTVYNVPPADPQGYSAPQMAQFAEPAIEAFGSTVNQWPRPGSLAQLSIYGLRFEPVTSRQLIARYGPEWLENRA